MKSLLSSLFLLLFLGSFAQKIDKQEFTFDYTQLPLIPLNESIKNYTAEAHLAYMEQVKMEEQKAEDEYQKAKEEYPTVVSYAEDRYNEAMEQYEKEIAAWNEKSTASKLVEKKLLNENNKPIKPAPFYPPPPPRKREVLTQKVFNPEMLESTYLKLEGFNNANDNAVKITATLFGFEGTDPELKKKERKEVSVNSKTKQRTERIVVDYWYETEYKHPINLKIEGPNGEIIFDESFTQFNEYKLAKTAISKGKYPNMNKVSYVQSLESQAVEENMSFIRDYINDQYGFPRKSRTTTVYRIKPKKHDYADYIQAFEAVAVGYNNIYSDYDAAAAKLKEAIELWETALTESSPTDKKARINNDVTIYTLFNLCEAYIWTGDFMKAEEKLNKIFALKYTKKEKRILDAYKEFMKDHKERWQANAN